MPSCGCLLQGERKEHFKVSYAVQLVKQGYFVCPSRDEQRQTGFVSLAMYFL